MEMRLPGIKESVVWDRAQTFAKTMVNQLNAFNEKHPNPGMSPNTEKYLRESPGELPGPTPADLVPRFVDAFYRYFAAHHVILPDEEPLDM
jgi:hypothetical protein